MEIAHLLVATKEITFLLVDHEFLRTVVSVFFQCVGQEFDIEMRLRDDIAKKKDPDMLGIISYTYLNRLYIIWQNILLQDYDFKKR